MKPSVTLYIFALYLTSHFVCSLGQSCFGYFGFAHPNQTMRYSVQANGRAKLNVASGAPLRPKVHIRTSVAAQAQAVQLPPWDAMFDYLSRQEDEFKSIGPLEVDEMLKTGEWQLVDVRPVEDFEKATIPGAVNVPLFQKLSWQNPTPATLLRAAAYAVNGVQAVEINPNFEGEMKSKAAGKKVITCCDTGGTMKPSTNFLRGKTSRSLKAAYCVSKSELAPGVAHLEGGLVAWASSGLPTEGEYDMSVAGRSPNSAAEAVFPDASEKK